MEERSIIFGKRTPPLRPQQLGQRGPRKKRSDAQKDIKFKVTTREKKQLQLAAVDHGLSLTAYVTKLLTESFTKTINYPETKYSQDGHFIHAVPDQETFNAVQLKAIEWGIPIRQATQRIIVNSIYLAIHTTAGNSEGVPIYHFKERR